MSVFEKKMNGNKRTRPRMARPSIDPKQEIIEYNQEKERIEQFFADKDDPHISLIVDITLLNSHPDVIEEIRQAFRRRYLHSPYVLIYMLSSDRNQCGNPTLLDETGLAAFNKVLKDGKIKFETADCKNLEPGIDPTIRINQLVSLAKYHQEGSFETCIVTEDKSLVSLAYNLEVACMSYGSLYEELVKYKEYCRKGNSRIVEGNLDWGLLLPEHMYEYPLSYHKYQVGKPSLNSFIDRFADYQDEEDEEGGLEQPMEEKTVVEELEQKQTELQLARSTVQSQPEVPGQGIQEEEYQESVEKEKDVNTTEQVASTTPVETWVRNHFHPNDSWDWFGLIYILYFSGQIDGTFNAEKLKRELGKTYSDYSPKVSDHLNAAKMMLYVRIIENGKLVDNAQELWMGESSTIKDKNFGKKPAEAAFRTIKQLLPKYSEDFGNSITWK